MADKKVNDAGFEDGEILVDNDGNKEKVVFDYVDGEYAGWHKEPVK